MLESFLLKLICLHGFLFFFSIFAFSTFWLFCVPILFVFFFSTLFFLIFYEWWKFCLSSVPFFLAFFLLWWFIRNLIRNSIIYVIPSFLIIVWVFACAAGGFATNIKYVFEPICNLIDRSIIIRILTWVITSLPVLVGVNHQWFLLPLGLFSSCLLRFLHDSLILVLRLVSSSLGWRKPIILLLYSYISEIDSFLRLLLQSILFIISKGITQYGKV